MKQPSNMSSMRTLLITLGLVSLGSLTALAGCSEDEKSSSPSGSAGTSSTGGSAGSSAGGSSAGGAGGSSAGGSSAGGSSAGGAAGMTGGACKVPDMFTAGYLKTCDTTDSACYKAMCADSDCKTKYETCQADELCGKALECAAACLAGGGTLSDVIATCQPVAGSSFSKALPLSGCQPKFPECSGSSAGAGGSM